jgi:hypothetical protein
MASALLPTRLALGIHLPPGTTSRAATAGAAPTDDQSDLAGNSIAIPTSGGDLDQLAQEQYNLNEQLALSLGYSMFNFGENAHHVLLVFQASRFKDVSFNNETYRFGVAIESTIAVTTNDFKGGLTLPVIAANVELNFASASSELSVRGYLPKSASAPALPTWGSFDVGSYADFQETVSKMQQSILFDDDNIRPVLLATSQMPPGVDPQPPGRKHWYNKLGIN